MLCDAGCGAKGEAKKLCGRCGQRRYCGEACQRAHWPKHRPWCRDYLRHLDLRDTPKTGRGVFTKRDLEQWATVMTDPALVSVSSEKDDALLKTLHSNELAALTVKLAQTIQPPITTPSNPDLTAPSNPTISADRKDEVGGWLAARSLTSRRAGPVVDLKQISEKTGLSEGAAEKLYGVLACYAYETRSDFMAVVPTEGARGMSVYWYASLLNHSCDPNCVMIRRRDRSEAVIVAARAIKAGEELTVAYHDTHCLPTFQTSLRTSFQGLFDGPCLCAAPICRSSDVLTTKTKETSGDEDIVNAYAFLLDTKPETFKPEAKKEWVGSVTSLVSQHLQMVAMDVWQRGWAAVAADLKRKEMQLQFWFVRWLIVVLPTVVGSSKLRLALFGQQLLNMPLTANELARTYLAKLAQLAAFAKPFA